MNAVPVERPQKLKLGIALILAAALGISIQDVVFKLFSGEMSLWQIFTLRGVIAIALLLGLLRATRLHAGVVRRALAPWVLLRSLFITTTFLAFYAAVPFLSLSVVGAANYMAPIFVALLSARVLREPVGPLGWLGVLLGFAGVVVLLQPGTDAFSPWSLLPIVGAAFYALAHVLTRLKCQDVPLPALALSQNGVMLVAGAVVSALLWSIEPRGETAGAYPYLFGQWSAVELSDWAVLALLAGFALLISALLAGAYQAAPPAVVSAFEYSYLVFVAAWDAVFFGIALSGTSASGVAMIVLAGLLVLRRSPAR